jgi:hypothetical protein
MRAQPSTPAGGALVVAGCPCRRTRTGDAAPVPAARPSQPHPYPAKRLQAEAGGPWLLDRAQRGAGSDGTAHATPTQPQKRRRGRIPPAETCPAPRAAGDHGMTGTRARTPWGPARRQLCADRCKRSARPPFDSGGSAEPPQIGDGSHCRGSAAAAQPAARQWPRSDLSCRAGVRRPPVRPGRGCRPSAGPAAPPTASGSSFPSLLPYPLTPVPQKSDWQEVATRASG